MGCGRRLLASPRPSPGPESPSSRRLALHGGDCRLELPGGLAAQMHGQHPPADLGQRPGVADRLGPPQLRQRELPPGDNDKREWEKPNNYFRGILLTLEAAHMHVVITHPAVRPWESASKESNRLKADAFKHLDYHTTVDIYTFDPHRLDSLDPLHPVMAAKGGLGPTPSEFWGHIWRNKINGATTGMVMQSPSFFEVYLRTTGKMWPGPLWMPG